MKTIPSVIDVENVRGLCNARCVMCAIDSPKVKPGMVMDNQTFTRLLNQFAPYANDMEQVNLVGMGETLVDPQICEKIIISKVILPLARVAIVTNAGLLSPITAKRILDSGCDDILLSIDSLKKPIYENIRVRLDFDKVIDNVQHFIQERDRGNYKTKIMVRIIEQESNKNEWQDYLEYWRSRLCHEMGDMILLFPVHKYPDRAMEPQANHVVCPYVFNRMSLSADGMIQLCCVDIGADFYPLGNILNQDPSSVFNGDIFSMVRQAMNENRWQELPYCNRCNVPLQREKRFGIQV